MLSDDSFQPKSQNNINKNKPYLEALDWKVAVVNQRHLSSEDRS